MSKSVWKRSLLAGVLGAAVALPMQTFAADDTSDVPLSAGEQSTVTHGVPNLLTTNSPYPDRTIVLLNPVAVPAVVNAAPVVNSPVVTSGAQPPMVVTLVPVTPHVVNGVLVYTQ